MLTSEQTHICCSISFETAVFKFGFQNKSLTAQRTTVVSLENIAGSISVNTTLNWCKPFASILLYILIYIYLSVCVCVCEVYVNITRVLNVWLNEQSNISKY